MRPFPRPWSRWILSAFFILAGANHFLNPAPYLSMMPTYLPWPSGLIWLSGVAEIVGAIGLIDHRTRALAAWGLIALLVAVFPANLNVAIHGWPGVNLAPWILWVRLPFQLVFIWWVYRSSLIKGDGKV
jgi:uncharacterized membrane protein